MNKVMEFARIFNIQGPLARSERKNKKLKVLVDDNWIHFGHTSYEDYTRHRDTERQDNYCKRAGAIKNKLGKLTGNDPLSANYYAMRLLWGCRPNGDTVR